MVNHSRMCSLVAAVLVFVLIFCIPVSATARPLLVEVEPNALQRLKDGTLPPMTINVWGGTPGVGVHLEVLQDCDGDRVADRPGTATCKSPLAAWLSPPADTHGRISTKLAFAAREWNLPENVGLWLRASHSPNDDAGTLAPFGLLRNPCNLWDTLVGVFFKGECDPGLLQALRRHKGPAGLEDITFEVRRLMLDTDEPIVSSVPGTLGATGVVWADQSTLLVTRARTVLDVPAVLPDQQKASAVPSGLYRVRLTSEGSEPELLWKPEADDVMPAAPFALPGCRIAFVRQSFFGDPLEDDGAFVLLSFWKDGALEEKTIPLPYRVHQILAASEDGGELLLLTLGVRSNRPLLLHVRSAGAEPSVEVVGYHHALYHAAMRSPDGEVAAIAFEDASGRWGWDLVLVDESGEPTRELVRRKKLHDLMPAWHPNIRGLAFLAEVSRIERRIR